MRYDLFLIAFLMILGRPLCGDPWGKDADMVPFSSASSQHKRITTPVVGELAEVLIRFHQEIISPADGPRSNYVPSSSQYTLDAMRKYGFFKGFMMGCDRLMRENDEEWVYREIQVGDGKLLKWDPVP